MKLHLSSEGTHLAKTSQRITANILRSRVTSPTVRPPVRPRVGGPPSWPRRCDLATSAARQGGRCQFYTTTDRLRWPVAGVVRSHGRRRGGETSKLKFADCRMFFRGAQADTYQAMGKKCKQRATSKQAVFVKGRFVQVQINKTGSVGKTCNVCVWACACMHACVCAYMHACACVCVCALTDK